MSALTRESVLDFIKNSPKPVTKREVAQAFGVQGSEDRITLKKTLKSLEEDGLVSKQPGGAYAVPDGLPGVAVIEVVDIDVDGDVFARPADWNTDIQGDPPRIEVKPEKKGHPALREGDRALARLSRRSDNSYEAYVIRRLDTESGRVMGLLRMTKRGPILQPSDKRAKYDFEVPQKDIGNAQDGDLVVGEILAARGMRTKKVRIVQVIGRREDPKAISLISLNEMGLREEFPAQVIEGTRGMKVPEVGNREDLRHFPLVTIDGLDARDFDDAVFAEKTDEGYHLIVAIADVAHYVTPGSAINQEAYRRGNSTYFPDRVVPMLPEALSNDLCSLRPHENRACLAVHMHINEEGKLLRYKFVRGLMRSEARLTYEQVQAAMNGLSDEITGPLLDPVIKPLYAAFAVLEAARKKRGALELDLPERQVIIDKNGNMTGVKIRQRLDSHKLIEEFMVLANVAAASALEAKDAPCVYRIHDRPSPEKLDTAREFIEGFGLSLPKGQVTGPAQINAVLERAAKLPYSHLISTVILRTQAQAHYSPDNVGHFGLALTRYAHFTSPIRRYADLLVHRSLIRAYSLGDGGLDESEEVILESMCEHISDTERVSMEAERNAIDRFTAAFLSNRIGAEFAGRISGVTRFGLFVNLAESGADGLVPISTLPHDFYIHDERAHALVGRRSGRVFRLGAEVMVRLMEADGLTGSTVLALSGHENGADIPGLAPPKTYFPDRNDRGRDSRSHGGFRHGPGGGKGGYKGGKKGKKQRKR